MTGTSETMFSPNAAMTRGMMATILYRHAGSPAASAADFNDVAAGTWYANAVAWAAANGIMTGYGDGVFGPNDNITREQLAATLTRYMEAQGTTPPTTRELVPFADADAISDWAVGAIQTLYKLGIITGVGTGEIVINPQGEATRAQAAAMLMRFMEATK
ncbi:MAG: S-layer homology domain-containing protein, partial [Defluviitaleaceae bacterium]|nr:S-layer homology domain-containing protein [Defluviitaleaceae bacterium]